MLGAPESESLLGKLLNAVAHVPNNIGVVRDENHTQAPILFNAVQQIEYLGLNAHV